MQYHNKTRCIILRLVHFEEHTRDDTGNRVKEAVEQSTVFKKKVTKVFINSKNTMAVLDINKFKRHGSSAFHGILISAGRAETASRNWLMQITCRRYILGTLTNGLKCGDKSFFGDTEKSSHNQIMRKYKKNRYKVFARLISVLFG